MPVVVEISQPGAPTDKPALGAETRRACNIFELSLAVVVVKARSLVLKVGLENVKMAIEIVIRHADPHTAQQTSVAAQGYAAKQSFFAEGAVMVVHQQITRRGVASDENILPSILVHIKSNCRKAVRAFDRRNARFF